MANQISKFKVYVDLLDEVYKTASCTSVLDGAPELARQGVNANELIVSKIDMDGLADYDPASGYQAGDVTFSNETVKCNFDRGRKFLVDTVENIETAGMAFGKLSSEFVRTKVVPELDAFRFATYCGIDGADVTESSDGIITGNDAIEEIAKKYDAMTNNEVPTTDRYLFATPTILGLIRDLETTKSKAIMDRFAGVIEVPQGRFYTQIEQKKGVSSSNPEGGFAKGSSGKELYFLIIHKAAVIQYQKHNVTKAIAPEDNKDMDAWQFNFREVGIADAYENRAVGIAGLYRQ